MKRFYFVLLLVGSLQPGFTQQVTILQHVNIIDGTGKALQPNQSLLIKDGLIKGIVPSDSPLPPGATVTDMQGKYLMPAIINTHGHLGILKDTTIAAENYTEANIRRQLLQYQRYGVGAVLSMGTEHALIYGIRDQSRTGKIPGATIYSAIYGFAVKDAPPGGSMGMNLYRPTTVAAAIAQVDSLASHQPDVIKIWVDNFGGSAPAMQPEIYTAIIDEAHQKGIRVAAHVYRLGDARQLVNAGLDIIAHSIRDSIIDDGLIAAMKQKNVMYIPTLSLDEFAFAYEVAPGWLNDPFFKRSLEPGVYAMITSEAYKNKVSKDPKTAAEKKALRIAMENLVKLYRAGVLIALGTDSGALPIRAQGFSEHMEMELFVMAGLTPLEAITTATQNGARVLKIADSAGSLVEGKKADFIVLNANPLENIKNTRSIHAVWKDGKSVSGGPLSGGKKTN